jgi:hypothetical protein
MGCKVICEQDDLGGFAGALDPLKGDEHSLYHSVRAKLLSGSEAESSAAL